MFLFRAPLGKADVMHVLDRPVSFCVLTQTETSWCKGKNPGAKEKKGEEAEKPK